MAVHIINENEVRSAFDKLLWVSIGQEPDVCELLASLLHQITGQELRPDLGAKEALAEVKSAAKGVKALLVLDDVW